MWLRNNNFNIFFAIAKTTPQQVVAAEMSLTQLLELLFTLNQKLFLLKQAEQQLQSKQPENILLYRNLSLGMRGDDVTLLQSFLTQTNDYTYGIGTGYYGLITEAAVKHYQCRELTICSGSSFTNGYGVTGPITRAYMARSQNPIAINFASTSLPQTTSHIWEKGSWSACVNKVQSRSVKCIASNGKTVLNSNCNIAKPITTKSCDFSTDQLNSCIFNDKNLSDGTSILAYKESSVTDGTSCVSQTRRCSDGILDGSYKFNTCTVNDTITKTFSTQMVLSPSGKSTLHYPALWTKENAEATLIALAMIK